MKMFRINVLTASPKVLNRRLKHTWIQPKGYDTKIKIYNCVVKENVPLIVSNKDRISWYTCGPTVYDSAHIGHASCYVKLDIIQRILKNHFKFNLLTVMNVTDIDDKIIKKSNELSITPSILAKKYENEFWIDMLDLQISKPDIILRVTDHIPAISNFIHKIIQNGSAYISKDSSVYFNLNRAQDNYGKLVSVADVSNIENQDDASMKKNKNDFVVWKSSKLHEPSWKTNFGSGRPGWHSECSALASAIFGKQLDIHAGGIDLKFPHHENEEAISCAHHKQNQWVNYWLHTGHLNLAGENNKMSKSLKNCIYIRDMLNDRKSASVVFRMACAMSHYKSNMEYSSEVMDTAEGLLNRFINFVNDCEAYSKRILPPADIKTIQLIGVLEEARTEIDLALKDDFNTSRMLQTLWELMSFTNKMLADKIDVEDLPLEDLNDCAIIKYVSNFIREQFNILGISIKLSDPKSSNDIIGTSNILEIINSFRQSVRNYGLRNKDSELLKYCDLLRDELKVHGIEIKDRGKFSSWNKL